MRKKNLAEENNPHKVFEELRRAGYEAVLLESGGVGADIGAGDQWTFIGIVDPSVHVPDGEAGLKFMREYVGRNQRRQVGKLQRESRRKSDDPPFRSGFVGFVSYDLGVKWQMGNGKEKMTGGKGLLCPEARFVFVDKVLAFKGGRSDSQLDHAKVKINRLESVLPKRALKSDIPKSNLSREEYFKKIAAIKEYLRAGDTYQVNFSQRFEAPFDGDEFELYKRVTAINPSAFQFFMDTPHGTIISNSPERLFKISGDSDDLVSPGRRIIETHPIKGTVPRGRTPEEEARNEAKLLASEKERAELAMIVDLERNDIGRLCVPGTVEVNEDRVVEKYSHVIHTASNIRGVLADGYDWYDALRALHPGGSITGCPKISTIKIINQLENHARSVYCGTAGYIDLSGDCDFNIMIRTMWLEKSPREKPPRAKPPLEKPPPAAHQRNKLIFHSGGGITVDSNPEAEYRETLHKARAIMAALQSWRSKAP